MRQKFHQLLQDVQGATTIEYALLLTAIALPAFAFLVQALDALLRYYGMMASLNALPMP